MCSYLISHTAISWNMIQKSEVKVKVIQSCPTLQLLGLYSPWNFPDQNTEVGSLSLLQEVFPAQGSNPGLPHCRWILYQLSHKGSPRILEWVAYPFSRGSSWPRNQTGVSCIADGFFTNWAMIRKARTVFLLRWQGSDSCGKSIELGSGTLGSGPTGSLSKSHLQGLNVSLCKKEESSAIWGSLKL